MESLLWIGSSCFAAIHFIMSKSLQDLKPLQLLTPSAVSTVGDKNVKSLLIVPYNFVNYYLRGIICKGTRSASSTDVLKCRIWLPCQFVDKLRCVCRHPKYPPLMYGTHLEVCILPNSEDLPSLRQSADRMMQFDRVLHCVHEPVFPP